MCIKTRPPPERGTVAAVCDRRSLPCNREEQGTRMNARVRISLAHMWLCSYRKKATVADRRYKLQHVTVFERALPCGPYRPSR